jgi:hypothetical protein
VTTIREVLNLDGQLTMWEARDIVAASLNVPANQAHMMLWLDFEHGVLPGMTDGDEVWFFRRDLNVWMAEKEGWGR